LPRVSIRGNVDEVIITDLDYEIAKSLYLERFPRSSITFELRDFALYRIRPEKARYVAGFGKAFNLVLGDFIRAAQMETE
jgi:hypothetical protein